MQLASDVHGPDDGPPIVFLGSLGTTTALWRDQVTALSTGARCLCIDLPGHGRSPVRPVPFGVDDIAQDVLETIDQLGVRRAGFVGLSIGGMVGQWLAGNAGDRVDRLAVLCSAAAVPTPQAFRDRAADVRRRGGAGHLVESLLPRWFTPSYRAAHPGEMHRMARMVECIPAEGYAGCAEALAAADLWPDLPQISVPVLVISGAQDTALPPDCSRAIAARIPGASYVEVDPGAHLASIERADAVNALLRGLLEV